MTNKSTNRFKDARDKLVARFSQPMIFTAYLEMQQAADMAAPFIQESNFLYLTGINYPGWLVLFDGQDWTLVRPDVSEIQAIFDGSLGVEEARKISQIKEVISFKDLSKRLADIAKKTNSIATLTDPREDDYEFVVNPASKNLKKLLKNHFAEVNDCGLEIRALRAVKTSEELALMQEAIDVTLESFEDLKRGLLKGEVEYEYQIEAHFNSAFRVKGSGGHAYAPIVAGGKNACTLHYGQNQARLPQDGLVLMDVGTKVEGYAADITRTYAVGQPTERQIAVHGAVQSAHYRIIELVRPGLKIGEYSDKVDDIMKDALIDLGLLNDRADNETYRRYFPHAISHGLGLDVHESLGGYGEFKPGMTFTIEPGIYIPEE